MALIFASYTRKYAKNKLIALFQYCATYKIYKLIKSFVRKNKSIVLIRASAVKNTYCDYENPLLL